MDSLRVNLGMDMESSCGQLGLNMMGIGSTIRLKEKESFSSQMETYTMESGQRIGLMVMEFILILMEPGMKATGLMIFKMEKDSKSGKMDPYLKAILEMA